MCRSHNVFRYVLRKLSFLVMCFTTTYLFMKQQALFVNMTERFQKYICHECSNKICKYIYMKCYTFIKFKGALDMEHLIWLRWPYSHIHNSKILNALYVHCFPRLRVPVLSLKFVCIDIFYVRWNLLFRPFKYRKGFGSKLFKPLFWAGALHVYRYIIWQ
jgi:hypothetical protein